MRFVSLSLLLITLVGFGAWSVRDHPSAPDATFTTITGKKIVLKELDNKPVLITFWATSCPSCITEIPHLIDLYNRYHPEGLEIIAVAMFYDIPSHVVAMSQAQALPYDVAWDVQAKHARQFGNVQLTPSTFLISADHKIVWSTIGVFDVNDMNDRIETFLNL